MRNESFTASCIAILFMAATFFAAGAGSNLTHAY